MGYVYLGRDPKINRIVALKAIESRRRGRADELEAASRKLSTRSGDRGPLEPSEHRDDLRRGRDATVSPTSRWSICGPPPERVRRARTAAARRTRCSICWAAPRMRSTTRTRQNVVHRDIKPANIMYDSISDGLKITDFGIARLIDASRTRTGIVLGTPAFMSPEQLEGKNVNGHTDLFALGVSLYQLLTGQLPFRGASMTNLMFVIANEPHRVRHRGPSRPARVARMRSSTERWPKTLPIASKRAPRWRPRCDARREQPEAERRS